LRGQYSILPALWMYKVKRFLFIFASNAYLSVYLLKNLLYGY